MMSDLRNKNLNNLQLSTALQEALKHNVRSALDEDIGSGDLTASLIPATQFASATIISRVPAIICGQAWAEHCFRLLDNAVKINWRVAEGDLTDANQVICKIEGNARALLTAERCALNFLQLLSATATTTHHYMEAIADTKAYILDTRKTLPGLRLAQKYAVSIGGGMNQRLGLYDGILVKENHIAAKGSITAVLKAAHVINKSVPIQIEVESLAELITALDAGAELILLDNFDLKDLCKAVSLNAGRAILEASGGVDLTNVREYALTGVDRISVGDLTKNVQAIDFSMQFKDMQR